MKRMTEQGYKQAAQKLAFDFCPPIYPCKKCGGPVALGYCCTRCGDSNPAEPADEDEED